MDFKIFQKYVISSYRLLMTSVLVCLVAGVLSYLFLLGFYTLDHNWGAPLVLSPTQEKVLAYQPQVSAMEAELRKDQVDLDTAQRKYTAINTQIGVMNRLIDEFDAASAHESKQLADTAATIRSVLVEKKADDQATAKTVAQVRPLLGTIDQDLHAGLITRSEASLQRLNIQASLDAITDAKAAEVTLAEQGRTAADASTTLDSNHASSLLALQSVTSEAQLKMALAQAQVDAQTARQSVEQLQATMRDASRVLAVARQSPYYLALNHSVPVAFVPYQNLAAAQPRAPVYDCYLQVVLCHQVGTIDRVYDAEEYAHAPLFKTDIKGRLVGVNFSDVKASESDLLFIGRKPLLL